MIRPYFTVIKDSFSEALASRVLWILLVVLTLLLLALAPLGLREERTTRLYTDSISDWPVLIARIKQQSDATAPSPGRRIWELSDDDFKKAVDGTIQEEGPPEVSYDVVSKLLGKFNELILRRDFYDKSSWSGIELDCESSDLIGKGIENLSEDELTGLNRGLFKAAFPSEVARLPGEELYVSYFGWTIGSPIPVSRSMAEPFINQVLAGVMSFFVGTLAVFIAILVTSPIIPHMFESGAIDLLLSKPVARPLLFLTKFAGGCAFILLNAGYFIVGLWLIMGLRFGLWNNAMLLCIPVFLFLFLIYYSVSALAAVRWKNAIVCVVITILFWAACFTVGTAKGVIEQIFLKPNRIVRVVPTDESLVAVNQSGEFLQWRSDRWETIVKSDYGGGPPFGIGGVLVGPVFDPSQKELLYIQQPHERHHGLLSPSTILKKATRCDASWEQGAGPTLPNGTSWLFLDPNGKTTVVATSGVYRLHEKPSEKPQGTKILGITLPFGGDAGYVPVGSEPALGLARPFSAAMHPVSGDLVVYSSGRLTYLRRDEEGMYHRGVERQFEDASGPAALALAGASVVVAHSDGRVLVLDSTDFKTRNQFRPTRKSEPYMAAAAKSGRWFAVLFHNDKLAVFDADGDNQTTLGNDVSAVCFDGDGHLLLADRGTRVTSYDLDPFGVADRHAPKLDTLQGVYRYFILPFYTIFPKPGELDSVVHYLLTDQETVAPGLPMATDLRQPRTSIDIYGPIWSSLAFVAVMLAVTCVYIHRMDF